VTPSYVGVDVGGTKIAPARWRPGEPLFEGPRIPTDTSSSAAVVAQIAAAAESVRDADTAGVGLGVPAAVDWDTGTSRSGVNVPLDDVPLRSVLGERLGLPVVVDNDANVAALAEACDDAGEIVVQHLVIFTIGTGVGGGLVLGGKLYRGASGAAAELGHVIIGLDMEDHVPDALDTFPQPGSLESLAAGRALDTLARRAAATNPKSELGRRFAERGDVRGPDVVELALAGDGDSRGLIGLIGARLGVAIAGAINTFDPDEVVVGGGVAAGAGNLLLAPAVEVARQYSLPGVGTETEIRLARHANAAGMRGAALLVAHEVAA
jgi:glucokinase